MSAPEAAPASTALPAILGRRAAASRAAVAPSVAAALAARPPVIALVGRPNVGKSTFLGRASGRFVETANVPGTTVEPARREIRVDGRAATLVDLPGTLGLTDVSDGLPAFWQLLLDAEPDAILAIVDAGDLARHLPLVLACRDLGVPIVVAANLADEARADGRDPDLGRLAQLLAAPVIRTVGRTGEGVADAVAAAARAGRRRIADPGRGWRRVAPSPPYSAATVRRVEAIARAIAAERAAAPDGTSLAALTPIGAATVRAAATLEPERWAVAERWARDVDRRVAAEPRRADRVGRLVTTPLPGLALFVAVTVCALLGTMAVGTGLATLLGGAWTAWVSPPLTALVTALVPAPALARAALWALDSGLLAMLSVGLPFVLTFYVVLAVLEDSGYLATTTGLTDRLFNLVGLPGRAAIPILAGTGCNVPAVYGTRVLESRRERVLASFLIVLTPCSARSAVIVAALAPVAGPGAALAAFGVVALVAIGSGVAANALVPGRQSPLVLELPRLRRPVARQVWLKAWFRFRSFVRTATPVMLAGSFLLGLAWETGAITPVEAAIAPVVGGLLGLPPVAGIALVLAFLRKELALQLLVVLAVAELGPAAAGLGSFMTPGQLFVYAVVTAVSVPCVATLATLAAEFGWRTALAISGGILGVGLGSGAILARLVG